VINELKVNGHTFPFQERLFISRVIKTIPLLKATIISLDYRGYVFEGVSKIVLY
jgi:hypothetical protein